jgi:3-hydroxyisobutyrate dehydrogenase-like beta-hydroxyacid dehydrogenase
MSRRREKNVGVIGLGIIGSRVAQCARRSGLHVFVWNRTARPFPNFVGARTEIADLCDIIQIFVSDDDALLETVESLKRSLKPNHIVLAHSTVAPHTMRAAAEIVQRRGAQFVDAPFTGSKGAAEKGELVYYVAGDEAALRRARPVLEASSKEIVEIGEIGQATTIKIATNMITAATVQAAAEALALVHSAGVSPHKFAAAMRGNGSNSGTLAMKLPKMIEGDFEPHFSVKHMLKDVHIAARLGRSNGLTFTATEAARDALRSEIAEGRGDLDYSAVIQVFFPDGSPMQAARAAAAEEQQTLGGLDEPPHAESARADEIAPSAVAEGNAEASAVDRAEEPEKKEAVGADSDGEEQEAAVSEDQAANTKAASEATSGVTGEPERAGATGSGEGDDDDDDATTRADTPLTEAPSEPIARAGAATETASESVAVAVGSRESKDVGNGQTEARRGLFSRMFGNKGDDA